MYTIRDLGVLPNYDESVAWGINNLRQVTGYCSRGGEDRPFLWSPQTPLVDLGTLGGGVEGARKINDLGQVVGFSKDQDSYSRAFIWDQSTGLVDLGTLGGLSSDTRGINRAGDVTGWAYISGHPTLHADLEGLHAFFWSPIDGMYDLGTLGLDPSAGGGINDLGVVVGESRIEAHSWIVHAFIWFGPSFGMFDMGTLGGVGSSAYDINNSFQAVGSSGTASGESHAFLWDLSGMKDLGTLGGPTSDATAINETGDIVGYSTFGDGEARHAFLYQNGIMTDLNNVIGVEEHGWQLTFAWDINERGDIVGEGTHNGLKRAWLLENNNIEGNLGQALVAAFTPILFGLIEDSGGQIIKPGGGPTPVPPPNPIWRGLTRERKEIILSLVIEKMALRLKDKRTEQIRRQALEIALRHLKRMLEGPPKS